MAAPHLRRVHVLGQGVAGSCLAWCLYRAGFPFTVWDPGHEEAASRVGAGLMNPITGQRLVPSWRWGELLPQALALYRDVEYETGARILRPFRIRREFSDEREGRIFSRKLAGSEFGPAVGPQFDGGFWIEGAWQADSATFIEAVRAFLKARGHLREEAAPPEPVDGETTIVCTGRQAAVAWPDLPLQPWEGAVAHFPAQGLAPDVILHRGSWVMPWSKGEARCGSTYWPPGTASAVRDAEVADLLEHARVLLRQPVEPTRVLTGWRVSTPDRKPIIGWMPGKPRLGVMIGLGAKGSSFSPYLAGQWVAHLRASHPFDIEVDLRRLAKS